MKFTTVIFYMGFCQLSDACIRDVVANEYKVYLETVFLILHKI
jgi:hypothetical protein